MRDRIALWASYVILVGVVAFGAFWINREFDQAQEERCTVAWLQAENSLGVLGATLILVPDENIPKQQSARDALQVIIDNQNDTIDLLREACGPPPG